MAVIYLRHDRHGAKVATSDLEAAYDKQHGWVEFTPVGVASAVVPVPASPLVPAGGQPSEVGEPPANKLAARPRGRPASQGKVEPVEDGVGV